MLGITLLLSSCSSTGIQRYTPNYKSQIVDPNTSELHAEILSSCPIPLFLISLEKLNNNYLSKIASKMNFQHLQGMYVPSSNLRDWPEEFIFLNKDLPPDVIISTYFHEIGHYICHKRFCICRFNIALGEYHANINEIQAGVAHNLPSSVYTTLRDNLNVLFAVDPKYIKYKKASHKLIQSKHWNNAILFLESSEFFEKQDATPSQEEKLTK